MIKQRSNECTLQGPHFPLSARQCFSSVCGKDRHLLQDEFKKHLIIADHYSARRNLSVEEREASPIIHLKKLNNWVKSVLIQLYAKQGDTVLDLACGK
eukprot:c46851_g1_i1 orf=3-296(+)